MIKIKTPDEIEKMREAGRLAADVLTMIGPHVREGVSTLELNDICHQYTLDHGAESAPLNYKGFPKSICSSINDVVCHGIPSEKEILKNGDIVNLDITVKLDGFHGDTSKTFIIGEVPDKVREFVKRVEKAMYVGIQVVRPNQYFGEIGSRIQRFLKPHGHGIVRALGGHGIGRKFHEEPLVMHHKTKQRGQKMKPGMIFTIEPMINFSADHEVFVDSEDGWTVYTRDHSLSAQFEHTVLVTEKGYEILTARKDCPIPVRSG